MLRKIALIASLTLIIVGLSVIPVGAASNDDNVEWDGLAHDPGSKLWDGAADYYRDRDLSADNATDPDVDDDDDPYFYVRCYKGDLTAAYLRTSANDWASDLSMSWVCNDPSGTYDYWRVQMGSILTDKEPGDWVHYHFKLVDGTDTENYLKADGVYDDPLSGTDFYFRIEGIKATPIQARANGTDRIYIDVYVTDNIGHPVDGETVTFSIVSGTATLSSTTAVTDDGGHAQVYVTSDTVGNVTIQASSTNFDDASTRTVTVSFVSFVIDGDSTDWDEMLTTEQLNQINSMSDNSYLAVGGQGVWKDKVSDHRDDVAGSGGSDDLHQFRITGDSVYCYILAKMGGTTTTNPMLYVAFDNSITYDSNASPSDGYPNSGDWPEVLDEGNWEFGCTWDDWLECGTKNDSSTPVLREQADTTWTIDGGDVDGGTTQASSTTDYWSDFYLDDTRNGPKELHWDFSPVTHELYIGNKPYNPSAADYFIFVAYPLTSTTTEAPWSKTGSVMQYQYKLCKDDGGWAGWQDASDNNLSLSDADGDGNTTALGSNTIPIEGKIDLDDAYPSTFANGVPERIYLQTSSYGPNNGDGVWDPVPVVNSDSDWNTILSEDFMQVGLRRTGSTYNASACWERFYVACTGKTRLYKPNQQQINYGEGYNYIWQDSNNSNNVSIESKIPWSDLGIDPSSDLPKRIRITVAIAQQDAGAKPKEVWGPDIIDCITTTDDGDDTNGVGTWDEVGGDYTIPNPNGDDPKFYGDIDYYLDIDFNVNGLVNTPPSAPTLQSALNDALVNSEPTLRWSWNDPDGDIAVRPKVWIQIYKDVDNDGVFEPGGDDGSPVKDEVLDGFITSYSGYTLDSDYRYFWRVKTRDDFSWSDWSSVDSFRLDKNPPSPDPVTLINPPDGYLTHSSSLTFEWSDADDSYSGNQGYQVAISTDPTFPDSLTDIYNVSEDGDSDSNSSDDSSDSYTIPEGILSEGTYYWRVRAYDKAGNFTSWSSYRKFTICFTVIKITEVCFAASGGLDWVELYVVSAPAGGTDIKDYMVTDLDGTDSTFATSSVTVHTGDYIVVHWDSGGTDETDTTGDANGNGYIDLYVPDTDLTTTDDQAVLVHPDGGYMDAVCWSNFDGTWATGEDTDVQTLIDKWCWTDYDGDGVTEEDDCWIDSDSVLTDESIARKFNASGEYIDNDSKDDWLRESTATVPSPGHPNWAFMSGNFTIMDQSDYGYPKSVMCVLDVTVSDPWDDTASDTITAINLKNAGSLTNTDISEVRIYQDNGDGFFAPYNWNIGGNGADTELGTASYDTVDSQWELTGLSVTIPAGGSIRITVAAKISFDADTSRTAQFFIPANGLSGTVGGASSNGPADSSVSNTSTQTLRPIYVTFNEVLWNPSGTSESGYEWVELYNTGHGASSQAADPVGDGWKIYDEGVSAGDSLAYAPGETQSNIPVGYYAVITGAGSSVQSTYNPPDDAVMIEVDDSNIGNGLNNSGDGLWLLDGRTIVTWITWTGSEVSENYSYEKDNPLGPNDSSNWLSSSIEGGTCGYYNGFRASEADADTFNSYHLWENESDKVLLAFTVPDNNGNSDELNAILLENRPVDNYTPASSSDVTFELWADDGDGTFDNSIDTLVGTFSYVAGNYWEITGLNFTIPVGGQRFYIVCDVSSNPTDGVSVRPVIPALDKPAPFEDGFSSGIRVASYNDGPVDDIIGFAMVYGIESETYSGLKLDVDNPPDPDGGWNGAWWWAYSITMSQDSTTYTEGSFSKKVEITGSGDGGAGMWYQFGYDGDTNPQVPTDKSEYEGGWLRFDIKGTTGHPNDIELKIEWDDGSGNNLYAQVWLWDYGIPFDDNWHHVDIKLSDFNTPDSIDFTQVKVLIGFHATNSGDHTFWLDNIRWETPFWIIDSGAPAPPTNIQAIAHSTNLGDASNYVELTWTASTSSDVIGYWVYRSSDPTASFPDSWTRISHVVTGTSFNDTDVNPGETWYYKVVAVDDAFRTSTPTIAITAPAVKVSKQVSNASALPFDTITYTVNFTNWGYGPAENFVILEVLNTSNVVLQSATGPSSYSATIYYYYSGTWHTTYDPDTDPPAEKVKWEFASSIPPGTSEWQDSVSFTVKVK